MRGKVYSLHSLKVGVRITPAYAGKSVSKSDVFRITQDHPRLCGEKTGSKWFMTKKTGSPPPMRGKDSRTADVSHCGRITPAYAGKR